MPDMTGDNANPISVNSPCGWLKLGHRLTTTCHLLCRDRLRDTSRATGPGDGMTMTGTYVLPRKTAMFAVGALTLALASTTTSHAQAGTTWERSVTAIVDSGLAHAT